MRKAKPKTPSSLKATKVQLRLRPDQKAVLARAAQLRQTTLSNFAALGVEVAITELDIAASGTAQADSYRTSSRTVSPSPAVSGLRSGASATPTPGAQATPPGCSTAAAARSPGMTPSWPRSTRAHALAVDARSNGDPAPPAAACTVG